MKPFRRRVLILVGVIALPILAGFIGLRIFQYYHVMGFETTMKVLVDTNTNGRYKLDFGATDINYSNFAFTIDNLVVRKTDLDDSSGVIEVRIPSLVVDLGPISSIFTNPQFEIDMLSFNEPVALIGLNKEPEIVAKPKFETINIPREIARFYPAVKTILDHFDVKHFQINRAGLDLEKSASSIQVRLLDLLVTNWNMRNLSDDAKLHLALGNQSMNLQGSFFSFSSIVWDYNRKELDILDYKYIQKDSSQREVINVEGAALKIMDLDYERLVSEEKYFFKGLSIVEPHVTANIHPHREKLEKNVHPLSDILKKNFGNLWISNGEIRNARLDLTVFREQDTIALSLPSMNLTTEDFSVNEDSSTLMIAKLALDVHKTELDIGNEWVLKYKNLFYDENYNARFDSLEIRHKELLQPVLHSEQMELFDFNVFNLIYENLLKVDSINLVNASIHLEDSLFAKKQGAKDNSSSDSPTLDIGRLRLQNVDFSANIGQRISKVKSLTGIIDDFLFDNGVNYSFRFLHSPSVLIQDQQSDLHLSDLLFESSRLLVGSMKGSFKGMNVSAENLLGVPNRPFLDHPPVDHWKLISISSLSLTGRQTPDPSKPVNKNDLSTSINSYKIDQLEIGNINAEVGLSDSSGLVTKLSNLRLDNGRWNQGKTSFDQLKANITSARYWKDSTSYSMGESTLQSDSFSAFSNISMVNPGKHSLKVQEIMLSPFKATPDGLDIRHLLISDVKYFNQPGQISTMDSVRLTNVQLSDSAAPYVGEIQVYTPQINLTKKNSSEVKPNKEANSISPLSMFSRLSVSPGQIKSDCTTISFDHISVEPTGHRLSVDLQRLAFKTPSSSVHIEQVYSDSTNLYIDSIYVVPRKEYLESIETEGDVLSAQIKQVRFQQLAWDSLIDKNILVADEMLIDGFDLSIKRDKTLPDPEHKTKPYLLAEFIPSTEAARLPKISGKNGRAVYFETGEETGQEGHVNIEDISFTMYRQNPINEPEYVSFGSGLLYNRGRINYQYHRLDSGKFSLSVQMADMPLELLNSMVDPLQAAKIRSGYLQTFEFSMVGDSLKAAGDAVITYDDLHVEIFKSHQPDVQNIGSSLLTLIVDKIVLKHSKSDAQSEFVQDRITFKGPINYWVKSAIHAASATVIKGKPAKREKKGRRASR